MILKDVVLVCLGYGIYAKARPSSLSGKLILQGTLIEIGLETMRKLGIKADIGQVARDYRDGESTQIPMATVLSVGNARVTRKIGSASDSICMSDEERLCPMIGVEAGFFRALGLRHIAAYVGA